MASNPITNLYFFRRKSRDWTPQDLADLARLEAALRRCGLNIETEHGCSDEGDPWFIFTSVDTEDPIIHIAYIDGVFVIASGFGEALQDRALGAVVESFLTRHVSRLPVAQACDSNSNIVAHPAALLPGVVAPLFVNNLSDNLNNSYSTGVPIAATSKHAWVATAASRLKDKGSFPAATVVLAALAAALHQRGHLDGAGIALPPAEPVVHDSSFPAVDVAMSEVSDRPAALKTDLAEADAGSGSARQANPSRTSSGALEAADHRGGSADDKAPVAIATDVSGVVSKVVAAGEASLAIASDSVPEVHAGTDDISDAIKQAIDQMLAGGRGSNGAPEAEPRVQLASLAVTSDDLPAHMVADDSTPDSAGWDITAARQSTTSQNADYTGSIGRAAVIPPTSPDDATPSVPDRSMGSSSIDAPTPPPSTLVPPSPSKPATAADKRVSNDLAIRLVEDFMDSNRNVHINDGAGKSYIGGAGNVVYSTSDYTPVDGKTFVIETLAAEDGSHITLIGYLSPDLWLAT
ncbi:MULTISPECIES: hypothetical protein [unclassified Chelatococcus]|uniref:hypothetical protein n=1 Tax=unclassified Chelatococcus TaxID=2638111 RepID=UPI001BD02B57|nr:MULTISPECIES: hypothetical protein [unclassified Chelatococcus]MBS7696783.1 hypothetical protein [Chelatococcus sp. YT9]MBX3555348.1 hypothetical protein [Chelatococcus sp.]